MITTLKPYLQAKGHSEKSIDICIYEVNMYIRWCEKEHYSIENMMYKDILKYIAFLQEERGLKQITIAKYTSSLKHFYNGLIKQGYQVNNPVINIHIKGLRRQNHHRIFSHQQLELTYLEFQIKNKEEVTDFQYMQSVQQKVMLGLYLFQGIDSENLKCMRIKDIDLTKSTVRIPNTRRSNQRTLGLKGVQILDLINFMTSTRMEILEYTQKFESNNDLFINLRPSLDLKVTILNLLKCVKRQFPNIESLKQIRASRITYWIQTENLREAQYRAGHKYISSTEKYKVHDIESLALAIEKFHPMS